VKDIFGVLNWTVSQVYTNVQSNMSRVCARKFVLVMRESKFPARVQKFL